MIKRLIERHNEDKKGYDRSTDLCITDERDEERQIDVRREERKSDTKRNRQICTKVEYLTDRKETDRHRYRTEENGVKTKRGIVGRGRTSVITPGFIDK